MHLKRFYKARCMIPNADVYAEVTITNKQWHQWYAQFFMKTAYEGAPLSCPASLNPHAVHHHNRHGHGDRDESVTHAFAALLNLIVSA